jgi:hypothetical protein
MLSTGGRFPTRRTNAIDSKKNVIFVFSNDGDIDDDTDDECLYTRA